jgi:hypothetical protein
MHAWGAEARMSKLVLSDREIGLIKGLIQHRSLNDQQVLAIFSFLDRNFNHREIGVVRKGAKPYYVSIATASVPEVDMLLYQYSKLVALAEQLGFYPTTYAQAQVRKAIEIFKTAVLVYNNNILSTRSETFIVLSIIAWTYLMHARLQERRWDTRPGRWAGKTLGTELLYRAVGRWPFSRRESEPQIPHRDPPRYRASLHGGYQRCASGKGSGECAQLPQILEGEVRDEVRLFA